MRACVRWALSGLIALVTVATTATLATAGPAGAATSSVTASGPAPMASARTPAAVPDHLTWPFVRHGSTGERVLAIQYLLQNKGFRLRADGAYGPITARAVRQFQRRNHLNASGNVGSSTWNRLIVTVRRGSRGSAVRAVQHNLKFAYGFRFVRVNGIYTRVTRAAVHFLQAHSGLRADGIVGHRTWKTIVVFEP